MNRSLIRQPIATALVVGLLVCLTAGAILAGSETNPYQTIVERNVFGLKPVPPPEPPAPQHPPPPKITLTGITTILGDKEVLMKVVMPAEPGHPPEERSLILAEGQQAGEIHVLAVNEKTGDVTIDDFGTMVTLNLDKDGAKLSGNQPPGLPLPFGLVPPRSRLASLSVVHPPSVR